MRLAALLALATGLSAQVEFPADRVPQFNWARELVWLRNIGVSAVEVSEPPPEFAVLAKNAGLTLVQRSSAPYISVLDPAAILKSRRALIAGGAVAWTGLESEVSPAFRPGAVSFSGEENPATGTLRREAALQRYWPPFAEAKRTTLINKIEVNELAWPKAAVLSVINPRLSPWSGEVAAYLPSYKRTVQIAGLTVPAHDALLLPIDVPLADPAFCRGCSGLSNSERLLYATSELTATEFENGVLSFDFYAPVDGVAVLQLEREPVGPMLAAGHPMAFDWDPISKRLRLPIPAGRGSTKRVRIAIAITAPDEFASFADTTLLMIGETNCVMTEYSSEDTARRSRLIAPAGWKVNREPKPPLQVVYTVDVPAGRLHGEREDLRLETDGTGTNHVRMQLLRPLSVHIRESTALHFGSVSELGADPPLVPVENANGRNISLQIRNNAAEIRSFHVALQGESLEFSPAEFDVAIGASTEREVSLRVFAHSVGLLHAKALITGPAKLDAPLDFLSIPRGDAIFYERNLLGARGKQKIWESARLRVVFDGARWVEFYAKQNGRSLLAPEGAQGYLDAKVAIEDDTLRITGGPQIMPDLAQFSDVEVIRERKGNSMTFRIKGTVETVPSR